MLRLFCVFAGVIHIDVVRSFQSMSARRWKKKKTKIEKDQMDVISAVYVRAAASAFNRLHEGMYLHL